MRAVTAVVLGLVVLASAGVMNEKVDDTFFTNMDFKTKQMMMLKLLNHITEPVMYKEIEDIGNNFSFEECMDCYTHTDLVKNFVNMFKMGMLPRGEIFTLNIDRQMKEVITMFHMLYYARDFTTFIKTACWMRMHCNEGMFVYALTVACRHREDCQGIILPPPYEIYPYYFVRADVIQKAYMLKMRKGLLDNKLCEFYGIKKTEKDVYVIDENVYDTRAFLNNEDRLRYFTEDIDLNTYYYYFHIDYPFWMKDSMMGKTFRARRWEMMTYMYQQILARYYLERLSLNMGEIPTLTEMNNNMLKQGHMPWMMLHNGVQMPMRMNNVKIVSDKDTEAFKLLETYEKIIRESIMKGYVEMNGRRFEITKADDVETLGMLIYGKVENPDMDRTHINAYRYLLILIKSVLGLNTMDSDKYFVMPSVLDSYQTALRDPVFYMLQKNLVDMWLLFKMRLPCYTRDELSFPGVKIDNIVVDKLVTYFDDFLMDMTTAVTLSKEELTKTSTDMKFMVRKRRLNHQPFKITIDVLSDKTVDCVIRMFLGPKGDSMHTFVDINKNRKNFVEIDSFLYKLTTGKNTIMRESRDMHNILNDRMMTRDFWKKMESVGDMKNFQAKDFKNWYTGFPSRLLLPRGHVGGMEMMLYVIVSPLKMVDNTENNFNLMDINCKNCGFRYSVLLDKMPLGFPLDRHIDVTKFFTPNMKFHEVTIYHKRMMCDMRMRWERFVLKNYMYNNKFTSPMTMGMDMQTYFTDAEILNDQHNNMNTMNL